MSTQSLTCLADALRGEQRTTPPREDWTALLGAAGEEGVLPLLADAAVAAAWDPAIVTAMRPRVAAETALAMLRERELKQVLAALATANVVPLVIKGAHLAYAVYPSPDRRPRVDTDLLIKEDDRDAARRALVTLGYEQAWKVTGDVAFAQFQLWRTDESGAAHTVDIHWRIANPKVFADRVTYDELIRDAEPLTALGANAFGPARWLALVIACLHRTAHHGTSPRLLWLYDIHLLASSLTSRNWDALVDLVGGRGIAPVIVAGLDDARAILGTPVPESILQRLKQLAPQAEPAIFEFLEGAPTHMQVAAMDWERIQGWRARARFLQDHLFPSADYIRHRYGRSGPVALPFLYAHRIVTGGFKWLAERRG